MSKETPAYEEWKVRPVKSEAIVKKFKEIIEELKGATTAEEAIKAMKAYEKYGDKITDNFATIALNYTLDTRDKKNIKNQEAIDRAMPEVQAATLPYAEAVLSSPFRAEIEKKFGSLYLTMLEYQVKSFSPELVELAQKENDLTSKYDALKSQAAVHFEGKEYGLGQIGAFYGDPDRNRRKAAHDAAIEAVNAIAPELEDIYDQLVKIRNEKAHKLGFSTYSDLSYFIMGRYDYDRKEVEGYREQIHEIVTPLVEKIAKDEAKALGLKALSYEDLEVYYPEGSPLPHGTTEEKVARAQEMYDRMGEETGSFFRFMVAKHLLFLDAKPGKALGGYMNYFPVKKCPIIFSNFNGTSGDVDVLTHEFGHAFQSYLARNIKIPEYRCPTMDGAEIDSMSMEFFAWPYMDLFFDEPDNLQEQGLRRSRLSRRRPPLGDARAHLQLAFLLHRLHLGPSRRLRVPRPRPEEPREGLEEIREALQDGRQVSVPAPRDESRARFSAQGRRPQESHVPGQEDPQRRGRKGLSGSVNLKRTGWPGGQPVFHLPAS